MTPNSFMFKELKCDSHCVPRLENVLYFIAKVFILLILTYMYL